MISSRKKIRGILDTRFFHSHCQFSGEIWAVKEPELHAIVHMLSEEKHPFASSFCEKVMRHPRSLLKLEGAYQLVVSDHKSKKGFLYRSLFCPDPIYFRKEHHHLIFSSSLWDLLLSDQPLLTQIHHDHLHTYLLQQKVSKNHTLFHGIERLPAGHALFYEKGKMKIFPLDLPQIQPFLQMLDIGDCFSLTYDILLKTMLKRKLPGKSIGFLVDGSLENKILQHLFIQCHVPIQTFPHSDIEKTRLDENVWEASSPLFFPFPIQNKLFPVFISWLEKNRISQMATTMWAQTLLNTIQIARKRYFWEHWSWLSFFRKRWLSGENDPSEKLLEALNDEMDAWMLPEWEGESPIKQMFHPFVNRELLELSLSIPKMSKHDLNSWDEHVFSHSLTLWFPDHGERPPYPSVKKGEDQNNFRHWRKMSILNEWKLLDEIELMDISDGHLFRTELWLQSLDALEKTRSKPESFWSI